MDNILALIPAYNEATHIANTVRAVFACLPALVVDDGSADDTARIAEAAGATVLRQHVNQGKGAALRAGFQEALVRGCDAILTLDADGQHDPADIPSFLDAYHRWHADLIVGVRTFREMPLVRRLANSLGNVALSWALGRTIRDNQCGYRLLTRRMAEAVLDSQERGFEFEVEMIATCVNRGLALAWVPVRTIYAGEHSHIHPWHHAANFARIVYQIRCDRTLAK